jgi:hypothetical protein
VNPTELEVHRRLPDQRTIAYMQFGWDVRCFAVERTAEAVNTLAAMTVLAIATSIVNSPE